MLPVNRDTCERRGFSGFVMPNLNWGQVYAILQRYIEIAASPHGKIEWQEIGGTLRKDVSEAELWALTVACKLDRCPKAPVEPLRPGSEYCPVVEQILYGEAAAAEVRNRIEEEQRLLLRGGKTFEWIVPQLRLDRAQLERIRKNLHRLRCLRDKYGSLYERGMDYLARAFGACVAEDPSFWPFVERAER
jgi:hypothetical protein